MTLNEWLVHSPLADSISALKAWAGVLLVPPVPLLLLALWGAWQWSREKVAGAVVLLLALAALWLGGTPWGAQALKAQLLARPESQRPLLPDQLDAMVRAQPAVPTVVLVLGSGAQTLRPEYGAPSLAPNTLGRLRYGAWLAQRSGWPLAYSGGLGHGALEGEPVEAEVAARVAQESFKVPLRYSEGKSRDTRENAELSVPMLRAQGIQRIILVTHDWHMPRSLRNFERVAGPDLTIVPAPVTTPQPPDVGLRRFAPTPGSDLLARTVWREWWGWQMGS